MLNTKRKKCVWGCCALLLLLFSIQVTFLPQLMRKLVDDGIVDLLIITSNTSSGYDTWQANTGSDAVVPWMECRFFNVTNQFDVIHNGALPQLQITPPMVYNEMMVRFNVSFTEDKEWLQYNTWEYYTYDKKRSYLDPKAEITIISPLLGALYYEQAWNTGFSLKREGIKELEKNLKFINISDILFWKGTAEDLLFHIYHPHIPIHIYNPPILPPIWFNKTIAFGLLNNGSNSSHSTFTITNTGYKDHTRMAEMKYSGKYGEFVDCWNPDYPLSPGHDDYYGIGSVKKDDTQLAFVDSLARNIFINYNYTYHWKGIDLYKYTVQASPQFDTSEQYPPNEQFFQFEFSGLENLTNCSSGLPLFVSFPYFLGGDERLIVNSMKMGLPEPSWADNLPYIDVEPITGAIFKANKSLQINTMIHSIPWIKNDTVYAPAYKRLPDDVVVPMVELSECVQLSDSQAAKFKSQVVNTLKYANVLQIAGYVSCGLLVVFCLLSTFAYGRYYAQKHDFQNANINNKLLFNEAQSGAQRSAD